MFFNELKPHGFGLAKNTVAFFNISRSSLRMRFSRRSRSFSWVRPKSSFDNTSVSLCDVIHLFSVDMSIPKSSATCLRVSPLVSAIRTASLRNSSARFSPIVNLLCCSKCYQRSGIKPRHVWTASVWQDVFVFLSVGRVQACVRPFRAAFLMPLALMKSADQVPNRSSRLRAQSRYADLPGPGLTTL